MATENQNVNTTDDITYEQYLKLCFERNTKVSAFMHTYGTQTMLNDFYKQIKKGYTMPETVSITSYVPALEIEPYSQRLYNEDVQIINSVCSNVAELLNARGFPYKIDSTKSSVISTSHFTCTFTKLAKLDKWVSWR